MEIQKKIKVKLCVFQVLESISFLSLVANRGPPYRTCDLFDQVIDLFIKVHLTPKHFFRLNKSWHLFETHCAFLPLFSPNLDFLQAVKVTKSSRYLLQQIVSRFRNFYSL